MSIIKHIISGIALFATNIIAGFLIAYFMISQIYDADATVRAGWGNGGYFGWLIIVFPVMLLLFAFSLWGFQESIIRVWQNRRFANFLLLIGFVLLLAPFLSY